MTDQQTCPDCGVLLTPIYENQGFDEPDPSYVELVGYDEIHTCEEFNQEEE